MGIREEIEAQLGGLPEQVLARARDSGKTETMYFKETPVTAYPRDPDVRTVIERAIDEVHRRHSGS